MNYYIFFYYINNYEVNIFFFISKLNYHNLYIYAYIKFDFYLLYYRPNKPR